jgi:DNA-binding Lrp family transcriptional regulator
MKKRVQEVFFELMKNSKKSDRDIAKKLSISQPTVTRIRKNLEKKAIKAYTLVPILPEIGIDLISFNFINCENPKKVMDFCLREIVKKNPRILFRSTGEGMRKNCVIVGLHKDFRDFVDFISNIKSQCKSSKNDFESFLVPTTKDHVLDFSNPVIELLGKQHKIDQK